MTSAARRLEQLAKLAAVVETLAGGDRDRRFRPHVGQRVQVARRDRLLEEEGAKRLQLPGDRAGGRHVEAAVPFDQQVDGVAHRVAHGPDHGHGVVEFPGGQVHVGFAEGVPLERQEPAGGRLFAFSAKASGVFAPANQALA